MYRVFVFVCLLCFKITSNDISTLQRGDMHGSRFFRIVNLTPFKPDSSLTAIGLFWVFIQNMVKKLRKIFYKIQFCVAKTQQKSLHPELYFLQLLCMKMSDPIQFAYPFFSNWRSRDTVKGSFRYYRICQWNHFLYAPEVGITSANPLLSISPLIVYYRTVIPLQNASMW